MFKEAEEIAELFKRRRLELNYTQEQLAEKIGCHQSSVSLLERLKRNINGPSLPTLGKIMDFLNIGINDILKQPLHNNTATPNDKHCFSNKSIEMFTSILSKIINDIDYAAEQKSFDDLAEVLESAARLARNRVTPRNEQTGAGKKLTS